MLISTKLHPPSLKTAMLPRKHLLDLISAHRDCRLISVSAPAGSGKTSLVCGWINREGLPVVWYSLDRGDNDPDLFFRYLLATLNRTGGLSATDVEPFLFGQKPLSGQEVIPFIIEHLSNLSEDLYLILDDYHLIAAREIHEAVNQLLDYLPPKLHVVIISRHVLPLSMSRLRLRGQVIEISSEEMKLSYGETKRFFMEIVGIRLTEGQVQEVTRRMEGWVGGLQLFALSLKGQKAAAGLGGVLRDVCARSNDYLFDEVINAQPEKVKAFLHATALLDRFTVDVCREVTGLPDATEILDYVFRNNLFLIPLDHEGKWYRYHHLFSEAVKKACLQSGTDAWKETYRTATLWFARNGYLEDAFLHAFASQDFEFTADVLEDYLKVFYDNDQIMSFRRWLLKLSDKVTGRRPLLRLLDCQLKMETGQFVAAAAILSDIESRGAEVFRRYLGSKRKLCEDLLLMLKNLLPHFLNPESADVDRLREAVGQMSQDSRTLCGVVNAVIPLCYLCRGRLFSADMALKEAKPTVFSSGRQLDKIIWFGMAATVERYMGSLSRSETTLKEGYLFLERTAGSKSHLKAGLDVSSAWIFYLRNDLAKAMERVMDALRRLEQTQSTHELAYATYLLALIHSVEGEVQKADHFIEKMEQAVEKAGAIDFIDLTRAHIVRIFAARGEFQRAEEWMREKRFKVEQYFSLGSVIEHLCRMELLCAQRKYGEVLGMGEVFRNRCENEGMMEAVLEIDLMRAGSFFALRDYSRARKLMEGALRFGESEGYIRPFVDHARLIAPVLSSLSSTSTDLHSSAYLSAVRKACASAASTTGGNGSDGGGTERLTGREAEILRLIVAGYKDKEIAEKTFVSINTVRTHARHIFAKLGVHSKVQAVRQAESLAMFKN